MAELEHAFKFNDAVLRHLTVLKKKVETGPSSMMKTVSSAKSRARTNRLNTRLTLH